MRQLKITKSITSRETASLDKYLQDIGREELVTPEQEVLLARRIKSGDDKALDKLVKANLRFVVSVAKQYQNQGLSLPDLINEGNLGLIKAAGRFDETRGFKFISYAVWWIRRFILQALAEQSRLVRLPLNQVGSLNKIKKATSRLEQEFERQPSVEEIAQKLDIPEHKLEKALQTKARCVSFDAPLYDEENDLTLLDVFLDNSDESNTDMSSILLFKEKVEKILEEKFNEEEIEILKRLWAVGFPEMMNPVDVATELGLKLSKVHDTRKKARFYFVRNKKHLRKYLE